MSEALISGHGLHKTYSLGKRSLDVLRGVDVSLERGEFLALRGASGAGKSTLLHLLGGLDSPTKGEVLFQGRNLSELSRGQLARMRNQHVGFIFQFYYLLPELDALENVCLPARMARISAGKAEIRGRELLARVGLKERMEHKPYELSGGEQQRVAIARALMNEPQLILADEPTGNLDSHSEKQTTLVVATHDAKVAARAPRVIELLDGEVKRDVSPQGLSGM